MHLACVLVVLMQCVIGVAFVFALAVHHASACYAAFVGCFGVGIVARHCLRVHVRAVCGPCLFECIRWMCCPAIPRLCERPRVSAILRSRVYVHTRMEVDWAHEHVL